MFMPLAEVDTEGLPSDLRRARSHRTRQRLINAYLEVVRETGRIPIAAQIARKSELSMRTLFERFESLDALSLASADHAITVGLAVAQQTDADRETRIASDVSTRSQACETWLPLWRVLAAQQTQQRLTALRARIIALRRANIERIELMYRPELALLRDPGRKQVSLTLAMITSFESWDQARRDLGLSVREIEQTWRTAIDHVLPRDSRANIKG